MFESGRYLVQQVEICLRQAPFVRRLVDALQHGSGARCGEFYEAISNSSVVTRLMLAYLVGCFATPGSKGHGRDLSGKARAELINPYAQHLSKHASNASI